MREEEAKPQQDSLEILFFRVGRWDIGSYKRWLQFFNSESVAKKTMVKKWRRKEGKDYDKSKQLLIDVGSFKNDLRCVARKMAKLSSGSIIYTKGSTNLSGGMRRHQPAAPPPGHWQPGSKRMPVSSSSIYSPSMPYYVPGILAPLFFWRHRFYSDVLPSPNSTERRWLSWSAKPDCTPIGHYYPRTNSAKSQERQCSWWLDKGWL